MKKENNVKKERSKRRTKRIHNREIILVSLFFSALMLCVIYNIVSFMLYESEDAINNSFNPRQELLATQNIRGSIYSSDGEILAGTNVSSDGTETRVYPYQNIFSHVVGYSTKGKTGIESTENMNLIHSHASLGNKIQNELNEEKNLGDNVITTLDTRLQKAAYEALGAYQGAIILSEPQTGKILAMVSKPDFDPNEITTNWQQLYNDKESSVLLNRATQGLYPPGSTFKIVTSLAYFRKMNADVSGYSFTCNGSFSKDGNTIRCYHGSKHGNEDFKKSFAKSCNSSFANIGVLTGNEEMISTCKSLLIGEDLGYRQSYSKSAVELTNDSSIDDLMQTSIGQGKTMLTPLQLNMITCAVANNGTCMQPYTVDRIESVNKNTVKKYAPKKEADMMTSQEAAFLTEMMTEVVQSGTATKLKNDLYTAAGKTGSAEYNGNKLDSHAWFTGFAPAENPKVCITVIVEEVGSGGDYAVPIAKRVLDEYFTNFPMINYDH